MRYRREAVTGRSNEMALKVGRVAARLFNKKGYLETNMEDIARASRLSKGGIYHYFSSKDEILFFILDHYLNTILEGLEPELAEIEDPSSKIRHLVSRHIRLYTDYISESKTLLHEAHCLPSRYYGAIAEKERRYYQIVARTLTEFFGGRSVVTKARITVLTFLLFGMCNWIYSWYDPKGPATPDELSETIWTVFLKGLTSYRHAGTI